ncbi:class I adenylate-forming enzyme family protein [Pseudorhodoferax sp.]|uniref:class I adenylate-forming enzyme family protein n=1 Tax=Pseudorhodoferax sp. TaxID=1993553 RepID=UPI002DD6A783|nr:class I adenylate-forming enzyme family protein [Pseudorhodoferax sp.]
MPQPPERLHHLFDHCLSRHPERDFLFFPTHSMSFAALDAMVASAMAELQARGTGPGDRVLVVAENSAEHVALVLACSRLGAWSCGVNARMAPAEVAGFIAKADPRLVCFTSGASAAAAAHADAHAAGPSALAGLRIAPGTGPAAPVEPALAERVATIIFTSGTTGQPKGVLTSHAGLVQFAENSARSRGLAAEDRSYAYLPMTHVFGLGTVLAASLHAGAGLVMRNQFDPADMLDALARHRVSNLQGPPALFSRLLAHIGQQGRPQAPQLRYLYTGAGPLDLALKRQVQQCFGLPLHHGYGLSEYAGAVCITPMNEVRDDTSAGYCVPGAELCIVDKAGRALPAGERGEIWIRGSGLFPGYFRDADATAAAMRPGGWYASGDLGRCAADGALTVVGRLKEMIVRSGFNVYPAEVEAALNDHPAVLRSAVLGVPASDGNEDIHAFVELRPGGVLDPQELRQFLAQQLAPYKRPTQVHPVDRLPMTLSGKVLKRELAARLLAAA